MVKSTKHSKNMGKKNKNKKKGVRAQEADPEVQSKVHPTQSGDASTISKINNSQLLVCIYCEDQNEEGEWLVQCDNCEQFTHFSCAGITEIREEDPWLCHICEDQISQDETMTSNKESPNGTSNQQTVKVDVHNPPKKVTLEDILEEPEVVQQDLHVEQNKIPVEPADRENGQKSSIERKSSSKPRSKSSKVKTISSSSSSRRREIELKRIEDELKFQEEVDAERVAIRLEALELKQAREKKYLDDKYQTLSVGEGSVSSRRTDVTQKSSYVSDWIESQQNQAGISKAKSLDENHLRSIQRFNGTIDQMSFDISIPVDRHEVEQLRSMQTSNTTRENQASSDQDFIDDAFNKWDQSRERKKIIDDLRNGRTITNKDTTQDHRTQKSCNPSGQPIRQNYQPTVTSFVETTRPEPQPVIRTQQNQSQVHRDNRSMVTGVQYTQSNQLNSGRQQKSTLSHTANEFKMHPRSRSTLLIEPSSSVNGNTRSTSVHNYTLDVQKPNSTYVFSRYNQPTSAYGTNSGYVNQRYDRTVSKPMTFSQPLVNPTISTVFVNRNDDIIQPENDQTTHRPQTIVSNRNADYDSSNYDQIYSYQDPIMSSMSQDINGRNQCNPSNVCLSNQPILSTRVSSDTNNNVPQRSYKLTQSQIASRHVISKDLPKFNGAPKDWCRFIMRYVNSTNMCGYSDDENLERLDKCLYGKAHKLVESLLLMPNSVPEIIDTLTERYGRPELVIKTVLQEVREFPIIKTGNLELLCDFGYAVRNACNQIVDLKLLNYLVNPELIQEIVDKLPLKTRIDCARYAENQPMVTLQTIANWLHRLSRTINQISSPEVNISSSDQKSSNNSKNEKKTENSNNASSTRHLSPKGSTSGFVYLHDNNNKSSESNEKQRKCTICGKDCKSVEICPKFKGLDVDQRWKALIENKLCRKCLKFHKRKCQASNTCGVNGCEFKHHNLLHNEQRYSKVNSPPTNQVANNKEIKSTDVVSKTSGKVTAGSSNTHFMNIGDLFRIVPVNLYANNVIVSTYAYLDEGSSFTLMERHIAEVLGLSGIPETICLLWTNNVHRQEESEKVNLEIAGIMSPDDKEPSVKYQLNAVNVVKELDLPEQSLPLDKFKQCFEYLREVPAVGYVKVTPTLLIGIKHAKLAVPLETVEGENDGPIATRSRLGWSIYGPVNNTSTSGNVNVHRVSKCPCQERDDEVHKMIKDHFSIENFGVVANYESLDSKENKKALKMMEELTLRKGNRFETGLLWKNNELRLPDNYGMARKRLVCLENKGPKVINVINEAVQDYVQKGYAHKLSPAELAKPHERVWYLPLFTVFHPKKPEKLRTVFDAAAKVKGVSLNSMLHTGPDLVPLIVDVLRRFRENKIAFTGDIKEMYHQVNVIEEDKHAQRFLWRNGEQDKEPDTYVMDVLTFGSRSSPCSAQYVKNLNATEFQNDYPRAAVSIIKNTYVDDLMDGEKSIEEAIQLIKDTKFVHLQGGFEIRNFKSNSEEVLKAIGEKIDEGKVMVDDGTNIERVLGMFWDTRSDNFTFLLKYTKVSSEVLTGKKLPTKRELLKLLMSIFDPLGLLSYYLVHVKILIQNVWRSKINWDDVLPDHLKPMWDQWIKILPNVEKLKIPRWYFKELPETNQNIELHILVDAGEQAFAAMAYMRYETKYGFACSLIGSKARVAPLKYMSTPRKELMAALLGTRLSNSIIEGLSTKFHRRVIWSDSSNVLTWLHSEHQKYSQFVGHRVGEILETSEVSEWRWVSTKQNVADEATKWAKTPTFVHTDRWFTGPEFLQKPESEWPQMPKTIVPNGTTEEMKLSCSHSGLIMPSIVNSENFSNWSRVVRAVAFAIRWGKKLLAKVRKLNPPNGHLTQEEILASEMMLFRQAQWQGFTEEMVTLTRNQKNTDKPIQISKASPIYDCLPYLDESGVLRVEGRIDNATALTMDTKRPIIMPRNHRLTKLLMLSYHRKCFHRNHETAINEIRQRFYIPRIRVAFRSARWNCKLCEIKRSRPRIPKMADLPAVRFEPGIRVYTYTGVDYFGPLTVMVGRRTEKRWGVLLTCLTIRAIHIEIVPSLDTESCIKVIRNFINLRGRPAEFFSDNGTCFHGANNELKKELEKLNEHELATAVTSCYTKWNFNPPASPHMGGCWESLIKTVKSCMKESMISRTPREEDLRSLMLEIMNVVNSRPLTYIPLDTSNDGALTPNHFILGSSNGIKPPGKFTNDGPYLRKCWKEIQRCTDIFWQRFIVEYIPTLTRRSKWFENVKNLEVGDIVIDMDENNPRNSYPKARIVETITGSKNQVRRARVQFANGNTLWRPAKRLAVLDVMDSTDQRSSTVDSPEAPTTQGSLDTPSAIETGGNNVGATNLNLSPKDALSLNEPGPEVSAQASARADK